MKNNLPVFGWTHRFKDINAWKKILSIYLFAFCVFIILLRDAFLGLRSWDVEDTYNYDDIVESYHHSYYDRTYYRVVEDVTYDAVYAPGETLNIALFGLLSIAHECLQQGFLFGCERIF